MIRSVCLCIFVAPFSGCEQFEAMFYANHSHLVRRFLIEVMLRCLNECCSSIPWRTQQQQQKKINCEQNKAIRTIDIPRNNDNETRFELACCVFVEMLHPDVVTPEEKKMYRIEKLVARYYCHQNFPCSCLTAHIYIYIFYCWYISSTFEFNIYEKQPTKKKNCLTPIQFHDAEWTSSDCTANKNDSDIVLRLCASIAWNNNGTRRQLARASSILQNEKKNEKSKKKN